MSSWEIVKVRKFPAAKFPVFPTFKSRNFLIFKISKHIEFPNFNTSEAEKVFNVSKFHAFK